ncbi:hypothetical protein CcCBS67573_g08211 [Chytriomyces confervae]|uniref:Uncharacterized protein n=1 Tax=Chytriomyces confervae TaxID=246404 RepID=A0A507ELN3_9FUNG|nr:hypothetical protein HDU80_003174 [Chytriomyces hyalinus]TPX65159.1 hypothetical protein CcCBS67573_g08211 [Chytriomyces confervae]
MTATKTHDVIYRSAPSIFVTRNPHDHDQHPAEPNPADNRTRFTVFRRFESAIQIPRKSLSIMAITLPSSFAYMDHDTMDAVVDCGIFGKRPVGVLTPVADKPGMHVNEAVPAMERHGACTMNVDLGQEADSAVLASHAAALTEKVPAKCSECMESACTLNASMDEGLSV